MSQKNQSSSNDTSFSFGANAAPAQAINDTPGSQESGGGGTMSYRAAGSVASTSSFTVVNQAEVVRGGSARRATSARSPRGAKSRIAEDGGGRSPSGAATREDEAGKSTTSSKRKPSTSYLVGYLRRFPNLATIKWLASTHQPNFKLVMGLNTLLSRQFQPKRVAGAGSITNFMVG